MKKLPFTLFTVLCFMPLWAQTDGYNADKTSYTTTLQHTPYSSESASSSAQTVQVTNAEPVIVRSAAKAKFQCDIDLSGSIRGGRITADNTFGYASTGSLPEGGAGLDIKLGARTTGMAFVGIGIGAHSDFMQGTLKYNINRQIIRVPATFYEWKLPIYFNTRMYIPTTSSTIFPFLEASVGGYVLLKDELKFDFTDMPGYSCTETWHNDSKGGFYLQLGGGCEFNRFTTALGWRLFADRGTSFSYGYLSVGVRL
ncbi:MAG: hypothetical protein MJZ75_02330 [Paludibacteraceae bacterium]|nr:hypothetical protein [Paludibacteraceae bacterium]